MSEGDLADLKAEIRHMTNVLGGLADDDPARPQLLNDLGNAMLAMFERTGDAHFLDVTLTLYAAAWDAVSEADPRRAGYAANRGTAHLGRYRATRRREDLAAAEEWIRTALKATPDEDEARAGRLHTLGNVLQQRFKTLGDEAALDEALSTRAEAHAVLPADSPLQATLLNGWGNTHQALFHLRGRTEDLDAAVALHERALTAAPSATARAASLSNLSNCLRERAQMAGSAADLRAAMTHAEKALELTPRDDPYLPHRMSNLALVLRMRYNRDNDGADLDRAIDLHESAVDGSAPGRAIHSVLLGNLGAALITRYRHRGAPADLEHSIESLRDAFAQTPETNTDRWRWAANLGNALRLRFVAGGGDAALDEAVTVLTRAVEGTPHGDPNRATRLHNLASALQTRLSHTGSPHDLDRMIDTYTAAIKAGDPRDRTVAVARAGLGSGLNLRFALRGQADDLHAALGHLRHALDDVAEVDADRPTWLGNLGNALTRLYQHARARESIDEAVERLAEAIEATPAGHPDLSLRLGALGFTLGLRYEGFGERADLDAAIEVCRRAADAALSRMERGHALLELGGVLLAWPPGVDGPPGEATREAVEVLDEALRLVPQTHPDHHSVIQTLAFGLRLRSAHVESEEALRLMDRAVGMLEDVARPGTVTLSELSETYRARSELHRDRDDQERDAVLARAAGLRSLQTRQDDVLLQSTTADGLAVIRRTARHGMLVVRWCLVDDALDDALRALELNRGLVHRAAAITGAVAERLRVAGRDDLASAWEAERTRSLQRDPADADPVPSNLRYEVVRALSEEGRTLVPEIPAEVVAAVLKQAGATALVHLVPGTARRPGWAIITPWNGAPRAMELVAFRAVPGEQLAEYVNAYNRYLVAIAEKSDQLDEARNAWTDTLDELCGWSGETVMGPLLEELRAIGRPPGAGPVPGVVLVPVGHAALVPWHAARVADGLRYIVEEMVVEYAASASMFAATLARPRLPQDGNALVVGNPTFFLPYAEAEAEQIHERCYPAGRYIGPQRTADDALARPADVLAGLPGPGSLGLPVIHLACHGGVDTDPARSRLLLAAGQWLTVERLLAHARRNETATAGPLVVLSACMSGMSTNDFDESLTLTTAFLIAGAATAVGSLWAVDDRWTADVMTSFHQRLSDGSANPAEALRAAQLEMLAAGRETTQRADRRSPADPYCWAAFTCQGSPVSTSALRR